MESEMSSYESETTSSSESEPSIIYCVILAYYVLHRLMVNQLVELNKGDTQVLDGSGSGSDSRSRGDRKRRKSKKPTASKRYQHVSELPKDMREALRVNKFSPYFTL
jgi:hypothetical protein